MKSDANPKFEEPDEEELFEDMYWARAIDFLKGKDVSGYDDILGEWTAEDEYRAIAEFGKP